MSRQEILNVKTLELKVPIYCEGCRKKVKKVVDKIDGVYQSSVDAALGKVTVTGLMDPETVIKKIQKARKPVRVWGTEPGTPMEVQLQMLRLGGSASGGKCQQHAKDTGAKGYQQQQQQPKEAGSNGKLQCQAKDASDKGQGQGQAKDASGEGQGQLLQQQQQQKGGAAGGGATKDTKMVAPPPLQQQLEMKGMKFPAPELIGMGASKMPKMMPFPEVQAAGAKDPRTVKFNLPRVDELEAAGSGFGNELDDTYFEDESLNDDMSNDPMLMTRPMGMPPGTAGGGNSNGDGSATRGVNLPRHAKKGGGPAGGAGLSRPMMGGVAPSYPAGIMTRTPQMMGPSGGVGSFPGMGRTGVDGGLLGGKPIGHPHMGGAGMQRGGGGAHGIPAARSFRSGGGVMSVGPEMLPMSQLPPQQQQQMAAVVQQQQQQHMTAIMQQQEQKMLMNGHGHHHTNHGQHHDHHAHSGGHGYPPPPQAVASGNGYGYGCPPMPHYPPMPYYYSLPPQRHPHDNFFSDENPNGCSVM